MTSSTLSPAAATPASTAAPVASERALPVTFDAVSKAFGSATVLRDITLDVHPGEVLAILGPSGCGKSTLLRAVSGLDSPTTGAVRIGGTPVTGIAESAAFAFQEPRLLPWKSIRDNVAVGLPRGTDKSAGQLLVTELLEHVELAAHADHRPREVSGGMAQRASLARALARRPGVLLLDEPFGALDALTRLKMQDLLLDIHAKHPATILLVTHDVDEALQLADRILVLGRTPGTEGATVAECLEVPRQRPRDRSGTELSVLRSRLLEELGVDPHRH